MAWPTGNFANRQTRSSVCFASVGMSMHFVARKTLITQAMVGFPGT